MVANPPQPHLPGLGLAERPTATQPYAVGRVAVSYNRTREILTRATGFMDAYDFTLNPYAGCSFGCTYCYAAFFSRTRDARDTWGEWVHGEGERG